MYSQFMMHGQKNIMLCFINVCNTVSHTTTVNMLSDGTVLRD